MRTEEDIMDGKNGNQTIGCEVTSCRFNKEASHCDLDRISVKPKCDCHSGDCAETECGSYIAK